MSPGAIPEEAGIVGNIAKTLSCKTSRRKVEAADPSVPEIEAIQH
jgi:hypothetical protein